MKTRWAVVICLAVICSVGYCFAQTQLVTDNFSSGSNGTYLGPNWTGCGYNNGAYTELVYQNDQAGGSGYWGQDCSLYTGYGPFPSDQYVSATVVAPSPSSSPQASVQLRGNAIPSTPEYYVACGWDAQDFPADYHYRIWSMGPLPSSGGPTSLFLSFVIPATNDIVQCQELGNTISMQVNGTTLATVADTSGVSNGYPGMYYVDPSGTGPSSSDVIFGNFAAGSGPPLTSLSITPGSVNTLAGSFVQFSGQAVYADGTVSNLNNWSSSNSSVATVDPTGFAYAAAPGSAVITGAAGADSNTANLTVGQTNGYTPLVHDGFTGTGGGYLGSNWSGCGFSSGAYSKLVYQNNEAGGSGYWSQNCALYTGYNNSFPNNQYATATVVAPTPSSTPEASVELRANATPNSPESYIACGWNAQDFPPDYHYRIWSLAPNGNPNSLYLSAVTPTTGDVVWCQVLGTTVTMNVNGTNVAVVSDNSGLTSGYPGMYYIDPNGGVPSITDVIFDNFVAGQVNNAVLAAITVNPNPATVTVGSNVQFTATGTYTDGSTNSVSGLSWSSSVPSIASVSSTGLASGAGVGTTAIMATSGTITGGANLTVNKASSTTTITSNSPNPSSPQQPVTISFSVAGGGVGPTGSVTVTASTRESCSGTLSASHTGSCSITFSTGGSRTLTAQYSGDKNFNGSTSRGVTQNVNSPSVFLSPSNINYGTVSRGSSSTKSVTVYNSGSGALTNLSWSITGTNSNEFTVTSSTCGTTLGSFASCAINVTFKPTATGTQSASLKLSDNASNSPQTVGLSGSGR
jgi:hypothetical protein